MRDVTFHSSSTFFEFYRAFIRKSKNLSLAEQRIWWIRVKVLFFKTDGKIYFQMRLKNLVVILFHPVEFLPFNKEINLLVSSKLAGIGEKVTWHRSLYENHWKN